MSTIIKTFNGDIYYSYKSMQELRELRGQYTGGFIEVWVKRDTEFIQAFIELTRIESLIPNMD